VYVKPAGEESHWDELPLYVTTRQKPNPPLWYPTTNPETVPRLAKDGFNTLFGFAWFSPSAEDIGKVSDQYFAGIDVAEQNGGRRYAVPGHTPRFGTMRHVFVAETDAEAVEIARPALDDFNNNFTFLMRQHNQLLSPTELDFDGLRDNSKVLVGSVGSVVDRLVELITVGRLNHFAGVFAWGSLTSEQTHRSLDLFQAQVIPQVRAALVDHGHLSPVR
jgi:alkanesulfonate monooxygenase SsuD/methylene tetrahydromethanopterin reductase-like flavin-dependent oxidoreductase (luciferase family)